MKKSEAQIIALERAKLIIDYIIQILSDNEIVNGVMNFSSTKIDNQKFCTLDIYVYERKFEKHLNLGINNAHSLVLYEQLLNDLLDTFLNHETMGISKHYVIKSTFGDFSGINAVNLNGSKIKINFNTTSFEFMKIIDEYTKRYNDFAESINKNPKIK